MGVDNPALRIEILKEAGFRCQRCGAEAPKPPGPWCGLDIHHKGAHYDHTNTEVLCEKCHYSSPDHLKRCPLCEREMVRGSFGPHTYACLRKLMEAGSDDATLRTLIGKIECSFHRRHLLGWLSLGVKGVKAELAARRRRNRAEDKRYARMRATP